MCYVSFMLKVGPKTTHWGQVKMTTTSSRSASTPHSNFSPHGLQLVQLTNCKAVTGKDFFISVERYIGQPGSPYIGQSGSPTRPGIGNLIPPAATGPHLNLQLSSLPVLILTPRSSYTRVPLGQSALIFIFKAHLWVG